MLFLFKQKTAYEMRISDWSSDVCSSELEACAGDPRRALGTDHCDEQQGDLFAKAQMGIGRLRDEQRRERHVDVGAVEIEAVAGRHDEPDDGLGAARLFQL